MHFAVKNQVLLSDLLCCLNQSGKFLFNIYEGGWFFDELLMFIN